MDDVEFGLISSKTLGSFSSLSRTNHAWWDSSSRKWLERMSSLSFFSGSGSACARGEGTFLLSIFLFWLGFFVGRGCEFLRQAQPPSSRHCRYHDGGIFATQGSLFSCGFAAMMSFTLGTHFNLEFFPTLRFGGFQVFVFPFL